MDNMNDIYKKITDQYKNLNIKLNNNEEIIIRENDKEIKAYKDSVIYFYKGKSIAHSHNETYKDVYKSIEYYLEKEPNYFIKQHKKDCIIKWIVIFALLILAVIVKVLVS